jgi:hypothetical protein
MESINIFYICLIIFLLATIIALERHLNPKCLFPVIILLLILSTTFHTWYILKVKQKHERKNLSEMNRKGFVLSNQARQGKLFCIIFSCPKKFGENRPLTVLNIWARKCDNYRFVTIIPNDDYATTRKRDKSLEINKPFNIMQPKGLYREKYQELSRKVFLTFKQVYQEFDEYDWYLKSKFDQKTDR